VAATGPERGFGRVDRSWDPVGSKREATIRRRIGMIRNAEEKGGWRLRTLVMLGATAAFLGCDSGSSTHSGDDPTAPLACSIPLDQIFSGAAGKDAIPALTNPPTAAPEGPGLDYLLDDDRVMGLRVGDQALAVPLNILWWHEIVNLDVAGSRLALTHCPLTGSSLVFDRVPLAGAEFGVSGLLYRNNLMMYDRTTGESLWPQMSRGARCGPRDGIDLAMYPVMEMTWEGWRTLYPETRVVTSDTGFGLNYAVYPYDDYDRVDNPETLFPMPGLDDRRLPKERVLGIPSGTGGVALPFGELERTGTTTAIPVGGTVVFWDAPRQTAMAFLPELDGSPLTFTSTRAAITDEETGSEWRVDGLAVSGPLAGRRLEPVPEAYVAFWFAWASFQPDAELWEAS
jgi:hypothetical protein